MASSLNLRQYQESILAKLDWALHEDASTHKSFLGIRVGGLDVLVDMSQVSEVLPVPAIFSVPNAQVWFLGTANVRGNLYAITNLAGFLDALDIKREPGVDVESAKKSDARILLISKSIAPNTAVMIERLIGLRSLEHFKKMDSNSLDGEKSTEDNQPLCFTGDEYEDEHGNAWRILDCQALVNLNAFMQAGYV